MVDAALKQLGSRLAELYASGGRPSIAPEKLLRALLLHDLTDVHRAAERKLEHGYSSRRSRGSKNRNRRNPESELTLGGRLASAGSPESRQTPEKPVCNIDRALCRFTIHSLGGGAFL